MTSARTINNVVFEPLALPESWTLGQYRRIGGYEAWERVLRDRVPPEKIIEDLKAAGLRGRGGAGFPTGTKWSFMLPERITQGQKYAVCKSYESETGTCNDRDISRYNPH